MLTGKHHIAGQWVASSESFSSAPVHGDTHQFARATPADVGSAVDAAEIAFASYSQTTRHQRAAFLDRIADEIEARAEALTQFGTQETGLPEARLNNERNRTIGQLRMFARHIEAGDYLDRRHDVALPDRQPLPRSDLRLMQRPIGPVAIFGASNFPLAFSVAGGDTASALAAGCPVVVKGHPAHPATGEIAAQAIAAAINACGLHEGVFSFVQSDTFEAGAALVQHPLIKAVGFTGSLKGGRALFDLCAQRPEPIPFFGELGSINPVVVLPEALNNRAQAIGQGWAASLTMGVGQFCTNPGVAVVIDGSAANTFIDATVTALNGVGEQAMLTKGIATAYQSGISHIGNREGVTTLINRSCGERSAAPALYSVDASLWLADTSLWNEVFGPVGIVIKAANESELCEVASALEGQLTCTLQLDPKDFGLAQQLLPILERKAGRLLANGFPTGVEVCDAMVHGGPYPASTYVSSTSVGTMAIRRFMRPVCYQDIPVELLPADLH